MSGAPNLDRTFVTRVSGRIEAVCAAEMLPRFRKLGGGEILAKGAGDIVTVVDHRCERALIDALTSLLPGSVTVGEEETSADPDLQRRLAEAAPVWLIDPLDGTRNFAKGIDDFASMVALVMSGRTVAAWIHIPTRGLMATAVAGQGAHLNGQAIPLLPAADSGAGQVATFNLPRAGSGRRAVRQDAIDDFVAQFTRRVPLRCAGTRYLDLALGTIDVLFARKLHPWDHAPGILIHAEAGGFNGTNLGRPYRPMRTEEAILVTPGKNDWDRLYPLARPLLRPEQREAG